MISLSTNDKVNLSGDLIEERRDGTIYIALFKNGTNETGKDNCIIRRITTITETDTGIIRTRIQYPDGVNFDYRCTWNDRERYVYMYNRSK